MVVRNVGGRVTPEVINDVAFIGQIAENVLPDGPLFEVAVIHHTQCGTGALADDTFRRRYAERIGADEADLRDHAVLDPAATVTHDVERLRSARRDPRASHRLRTRLRRRHRTGSDDPPRPQCPRPKHDTTRVTQGELIPWPPPPPSSNLTTTSLQSIQPSSQIRLIAHAKRGRPTPSTRPRDARSGSTPTTTRPRDARSELTPTTTRPRDARSELRPLRRPDPGTHDRS